MLCAVLLLGLLPAAALADAPQEPDSAQYEVKDTSEPVKLPGVSINDWDLYLGIGRFDNDGIKLARSSSFIAPSNEWNWGTYSIILWTKNGDDYERVGTNHYNSNDIVGWGKLSDIKLSAPQSTTGNENTPQWQERYENGWPIYSLGLNGTMTGTWKITASCTLGGTEYKVSCEITRTKADETTIEADKVGTLDELNAVLTSIMQDTSAQPKWYYIHLPAQTYTGTITIPKEETGSGRRIVHLYGSEENGVQTTIQGGIQSDNDMLFVQNIHFTGAGQEMVTLNGGTTPNSALYGSGQADSFGCTFENYFKAVVWEGNRRLFGRANTYKNNNIAWYVDLSQGDASGDTQGVETTFENNSCAIYVESVGDLTYTGKITDYTGNNVFRDNATDIRNDSGRAWFMTESYFVHGTDDAGNDIRELKFATNGMVSCYPMRRDDTFYYDYKQDAQTYRISNYNARLYPTPAENLDGKTFEVIDPEAMTKLALFSFPEKAESVNETQTEFDATVRISRSDNLIDFIMNNPGRKVYVTLPCAFTSGTVTHNGEELDGAAFENGSVRFGTADGGEYVIKGNGPALGEVTGCKTVAEINTALKEEFAKLEAAGVQELPSVYVYLSEAEYTGQIVVPELPENLRNCGTTVVIRSAGSGRVTLKGGIRSDSTVLFAEGINFIGAGKDENGAYYQNWPEGTDNAGAENAALYGDAGGGQAGCSFTGYYYAVKRTKGMRACGVSNQYRQNHIAWYLGEGNSNGGNFDARYCIFEKNDIAIQVENFNFTPRQYAPKNCQFVNNELDIQNKSGRAWCIPENLFTHSDDEGNAIFEIRVDTAASPVSCFPMRDGDQGPFRYEYKQAAETYLISNNLAGSYPIPQENLSGKTFEIIDEDTEQTLVTLIFDNSVSTTTDPFNATVRVERVGTTISFDMNSTGRPVTVKLPCAFETGTVTHNGTELEAVFDTDTQYVSFKTSAGGKYVIESSSDGGEQFEPGVPKPITVTIDGKEKTCYFGVGEFINGRYTVLTGSYIGAMSIEDAVPRLAVGLWWKNSSGEFTMLSPSEAEQVTQQAKFSLGFQPLSAAPGDLPARIPASEDEYAAGMPATSRYLLKARHEGNWRVVATCTMKDSGETYTACGEFERGIINYIDVTSCKTVDEINDTVQKKLNQIENSGTQRRTQMRVIMEEPEYTGQIVVPEIPEGIRDIMDGVSFEGHSNSGRVTLRGGISSDSTGIYAANISFIGAGKDADGNYLKNWPADGENAGEENAALYGKGGGSEDNCVFTDYYYAIKMTGSVRLCGTRNHFKNNHIAWYVEYHDGYGGNPNAAFCVFEKNDIAIQIDEFSEYLPMSFYAPGLCEFINNKLDIQNNSGRPWFIPGNYFVHGKNEDGSNHLKTMINPGMSVSCYPMRRGDTFYYEYEQGATNYLLSNDLTGAYPTPQEYLDGKTFEVVDVDEAAKTTTTLATFSFPETQTQSSIALFSAETAAFDATVHVERTEDRIVFTMNDPCKPVTVTLPCEFKYGTVTHNGKQLETVTFDGETVSFETDEGGEYTIKYELDGYLIAAGYDALGRLVGVQFFTGGKTPNIPGAVTTKTFILDDSYRPVAQNW